MKRRNTVLVVDSGGRGSVLVEKYSQSPNVDRILAVPGNDLMQVNTPKSVKIYPSLKTTDVKEIIDICKKEKVILVDVAQDDAVAMGLVNALAQRGIPALGPTKEAGRIEWDKAWARNFMTRYRIPQPAFKVCRSAREGQLYIKKHTNQPWFVKAFGLAQGKGALPAVNNKEAIEKILEMKRFGDAGKTYLLEQWISGEEFSTYAICNGVDFQIVGSAQDHKRMFNFDQGENTGGVGSSTPALVVTPGILKQVEEIFRKTLRGLKKEGRPYKGVLYLGGMVVKGKVYVIEFNARWGDPEAEVIIPGIENDFFDLGMAVVEGGRLKLRTDGKARVVVTGLLNPYQTEVRVRRIYGLGKILRMKGVKVYGTRVKKVGRNYFALSGRLFHIVGEGKDVIQARRKAYEAMSQVYIEGNNLHYRTDIGWRDVERLKNDS
ncbi:MAG: phosphoribosylamine--glycine ligase [bacterium]|nr:phosphoribosylamine--glycine ligase [bacterium]